MTGAGEHIACSVVLPVLRDGPGVQEALRALAGQTLDASYEVIVVSQAAIDVSACPRGRFVRDEGRGPGVALNTGISAAKGDVLAFTDAECIPESAWLAEGLACLSNSGAGLTAGHIEQTPAIPGRATPVEQFEVLWSLRQDEDVRHGVASASNLFARRGVFARIGAFREDMPSKCDWELCERARDAGLALTYCDAAVVRHRAIATWDGLWQSKLRLAEGMARLHRARGRGRSAARRDALRQLRPPLRSLAQVIGADAALGRKVALLGTLVVSRFAYLAGWARSEVGVR